MWYTSIATKRPLGPQTEARLARKNKVILHTMVGSLWGTDAYFRQGGYSGTESHFGVGYDGEVLQWQDDDYQADANLQGNDDAISIETADRGPGFPDWNTSGDNVPAWTPAEGEAIARILSVVCPRHGIPLVLITNTKDATKGIGYHRQGIDPYRESGEYYSTSFGKVCPGNRRVAQIPGIIARAKQLVAEGLPDTGAPEELFTVSQYDDIMQAIREVGVTAVNNRDVISNRIINNLGPEVERVLTAVGQVGQTVVNNREVIPANTALLVERLLQRQATGGSLTRADIEDVFNDVRLTVVQETN